MSFSNYGASNNIISLRPKESKEAVFQIKGQRPGGKEILDYFFSYYSTMADTRNNLLGSTRYFNTYVWNYMIISLTPKSLLKTQFLEKNGHSPSEKAI